MSKIIAVCSPELNGDVLWAVPAARALAKKHGCKADFWVSSRGGNIADLLEAQAFVEEVFIDDSYEAVGGGGPRGGGPHDLQEPMKAIYDYDAIYQLGFRQGTELNGTLLDYFCRIAGVPRQAHYFDLPRRCPKEPLPKGSYVVLAANNNTGTHPWVDVFRDFVYHCPLPVVEVGLPGKAVALDYGSWDRHRPGFLEMTGIISKASYFVGTISSPLVLADAMPNLPRIAVHDGQSWNMSACTHSGDNHYLHTYDYKKILEKICP